MATNNNYREFINENEETKRLYFIYNDLAYIAHVTVHSASALRAHDHWGSFFPFEAIIKKNGISNKNILVCAIEKITNEEFSITEAFEPVCGDTVVEPKIFTANSAVFCKHRIAHQMAAFEKAVQEELEVLASKLPMSVWLAEFIKMYATRRFSQLESTSYVCKLLPTDKGESVLPIEGQVGWFVAWA